MQPYEEGISHQVGSVRLHPEMMQLDNLRAQLARLIEQQDFLENHQKPILDAIYNHEIGGLEFELLQLRAERQRLKRKLEMLSIRTNRGEKINDLIIKEVDEHLEREFKTWKQKLIDHEKRLEQSERLLGSLQAMSDQDSRRLKAIYRKICKLIHPDITESMLLTDRYWMRAQNAYREGNIDQLEVLLILIRQGTAHDSQCHVHQADEADRLQKLISTLAETLDFIESQPPYCYADKIMDNEWITRKRESLLEEIEFFRQDIMRYKMAVKLMIDCPETEH